MTRSVAAPEQPARRAVLFKRWRPARRLYLAAASILTSRQRKTLHHELAWWPVVASLVIMLIGFVATSSWLAYQSVSDRKRLLLTFAQFARNDLEMSLSHVFSQVQDLAARWEGLWSLTSDVDPQRVLIRLLEPVIVQKGETNKYDLLLFVEKDGKVFKAVSGAMNNRSLLDGLEGKHYSTVLGSSSSISALNQVLNAGKVVGISVQQFPEVNRLLGRPARPRTREEVPASYQFVIAVPVPSRVDAAVNDRRPMGAVVAIVSWRPFQDILDEIERKSALLNLDTGYAYLMNSDGNTTIGHKRRDPAGTNLYETRVEEDHHLFELRRLLRDSPGVVHGYWFLGVRKYAALQRISPPSPALEDALAWRLGVGVDLPDMLWAAVPSAALVFAVGLFVTVSVYVASHIIASRASLSVKKLTQLVDAASKGQFTVVSAGGSHEELSELHESISRLIVTLRAEVGFVPLPNPYVVGTPVRTADMFFGRERDLAWIADQLKTPGNELILLSGPRRIGKTSLLHSVRRSSETIGILPFFFDTQMLMQEITDDKSFYTALVSGLVDQLAQRHPGIPAPRLDGYSGEPIAVRKFLKYVTSRVESLPVLLFDELENLQYKVQHHLLSQEVFSLFAALLDSELPVSLVVTGSDHFERRPGGALGALFVKAMRRRVSVLAPEEAREILVNPLKGRLDYEEGTIDRILRFTGNHPYFTQDFCHRMVSTLNHLRQIRVTHQIVNEVVNRVLDNPPPQLDYAWDQLPNLGSILVRGVAAAITKPEDFVDLQNAINTLPPDYREELPRKRHRMHNALVSLIHRDWLEHSDQGYRFKIDLYRLWVKREHPPTQLRAFDWDTIGKGYAEQSVS
jgi:hypothetical protein